MTIPERYKDSEQAFRVTAADVRSDLRASNAALPENGIAVLCSGRFLNELRVCLSKDDLLRAPAAAKGPTVARAR